MLDLRARELAQGVNTTAYYLAFEERVRETKRKDICDWGGRLVVPTPAPTVYS